jgi:uncharacterized protein YdeI (BOF family)
MRISSFLAFSTLGLAIVACRSDSNNNTDGNPGGDTGSNGASVTIQMVQDDSMAPGTPVTLRGVVVTAIDTFGAKTGDIWVEEPEGGTFSGVHVFGASSTDVAALTVGDMVDVTGAVKDEFALTGSGGDTSGRTVTELKAATSGSLKVTKTGPGTLPAPVSVNALMIGQLPDADMQGSAFSAAWEPYEGVLVSLDSVSALGSPKSFGSSGGSDAYSFDITGVARVEGNFTDINNSGIARNTCLNLTGVVDYFFDYLVLPRSSADIDTSATGCPVAEAVCNDSVDNDGNGFADCKDNSCIINDGTCSTTTTISALDMAADANPASPTLPTGGVKLSGLCVTAVPAGTSPSSAYLSTNAAGGADNGIFMFGGGTPLPSGVIPGTKVDVIGTVSSFKSSGSTAPEGQLEIAGLQVTKVNGSCNPTPATETSDMSVLTQDANGHPLIGSLVLLQPAGGHSFKITTAQTVNASTGNVGKFGVFTENGTTVKFGVTMLSGTNINLGAVNDCYGPLTGIWTYDTTGAGGYEILPTTMPTKLTTCVP